MAERFYGTGKRKNAVARVWIAPGEGSITINNKTIDEYFGRMTLVQMAREPLTKTPAGEGFSIQATTHGGGMTGQAGALRHGIAKALVAFNEELRPAMREIDAMTRDPRVKERKKYGRKRARRGFQFSKR